MRKFVLFAATGGGSGLSPVAPGTAGSVVGVLLWIPLAGLSPMGFGLALVGVTALAIWSAGQAERIYGKHDDQRITIDEVAGVLVALAFLPARPEVAVAGFVLFRIFDIWKPPPVRRFERLPGGVGVVADDLMAGLYANAIGQVLWRVILPEGLS